MLLFLAAGMCINFDLQSSTKPFEFRTSYKPSGYNTRIILTRMKFMKRRHKWRPKVYFIDDAYYGMPDNSAECEKHKNSLSLKMIREINLQFVSIVIQNRKS